MKTNSVISRNREKGVVLPLAAVSLLSIVMCTAVAVDTFTLYSAKRQLITIADLAARAGLNQYELTGDSNAADSKARSVVLNNRLISQNSPAIATVEFGTYDGINFAASPTGVNAAKVSLLAGGPDGNPKLFFGKLLRNSGEVRASGVAYIAAQGSPVMLAR